MRLKKKDISTNVHKLPKLNFEKQNLTSFSGIVIFYPLFKSLELKNIPEVSTMTRVLDNADEKSVDNVRNISKKVVSDRIITEGLSCITLNFDGSVFSTSSHTEGTAVGYNKKKKGARLSYSFGSKKWYFNG